jgi:hypothetical protein
MSLLSPCPPLHKCVEGREKKQFGEAIMGLIGFGKAW